MAFKFRLQRLLEYREKQKKQEQEELARRQRKLAAARQELTRVRGEQQRLQDKHRQLQQEELNILTLISLEEYGCSLEESYRRGMDALHREENNVRQQRCITLDAWRSCQVLVKLREKAHQEYRVAENINEQNLNDELGLNSHRNKTQEAGNR